MAANMSLPSTFYNATPSPTVVPFHNTVAPTDEDNERRGLILLVVACVCCGLWLIYMTFYHSRLLGSIITKLVTMRYLKDGQFFEIGSFSFSILSGKIMFRDVKYITKDLSIRIVDGYAIFKYWLPYVAENYRQPYNVTSTETSTEIESKEHRLTIWMNCFEYHVYNRAGLYDQLQDLFRVERYGDAAKSSLNIHNVIETTKKATSEGEKCVAESNKGLPTWLLELVPAIKFDVSTGKIAFGNKMFETTLCFLFENAAGYYTTSEAHSSLDQFMHVVRMTGKNVRIMLCPSPGYTGSKDEPPRFMGNGFVVLHTAQCKISYYQDEPGLVPEVNVGDVDAGIPDSDPHWGVDVAFLKNTSMSYGPWVDRQRDALQKFFFPMDYQEMFATKPLPPGQTRLHTGLDIKFHFTVDATLDILFSKNQETKAVHVCFGAGSHIDVYQPWTVNEYGYTTSVITKLFQVEASTSMAYRKLVDADVLDVAVHMTFPRVWNQTQHWSCEINAVRVTWWFIFSHKWYFQELLEDWSANYRPDLVTFVPYEWSFNIVLRDFEMVWIANEYNYIECTSNKQEMAELAFCGELFDLTFVLQFLRFLPEIEEIKFFLQVEKLVARLCLPEHDTLHRSLLCLARNATKSQTQPSLIRSRSSTITGFPEECVESADENAFNGSHNDTFSTIFSRHTAKNHGWVDVMSVPILGLSIGYMYHPIIPNTKYNVPRDDPLKWQPWEMEPDVITLELEAGPAALRLFGSVLKVLAAIKENYFGEDQVFQECPPFNSNMSTFSAKEASEVVKETINLFTMRPLEANVLISLYDFKAELTKHCGASEPSSPLLLFERLTFEMKKSYHETRLQLNLTPMTILVSDGYERGSSARHLSQGHLSLSGFQLRGHAMFSGEGLPPDGETLEYAWLTELQFGTLSGKITIPQLQAILNWAQTFVFHIMCKENTLQPPVSYKRCVHGQRQDKCKVNKPKPCETHQKSPQPPPKNERNSKRKVSEVSKTLVEEPDKSEPKDVCITEDDVKYRMTRMSLEEINLFVVETGIACNVQVSPIRLGTCTLHCDSSTTGVSMFIQNVKLRQFVLAPKPLVADPVFDDIHKRMSMSDDVVWMEAASVQLGPIISDISLAEDRKENVPSQRKFLELHDKKYQRVWFLWNTSSNHKSPVKNFECCGCVGGCNFFGKNVNGPRFFTAEKLDASYNDTGIAGFGSEGGFYDEGDFHEEDTKPLMYSRDALGSAYLDQSPAGSVEAFTRKRYHGSEASSSPTMRRGYLMRNRHSNTDENNPNDPTSRLSWTGSLQRSPSTSSSKMRFGPSLSSSKPSLVKKPRAVPLTSCSSQASFYSCGSLADDQPDTSDYIPMPLRNAFSTESFASAVEHPHDLPDFVDGTSPHTSDFIVSCPQLVSRYSQQLSQLECLNWSLPADIPPNKKVFNIVENLKETEPSDPLVLPGVPQFIYRIPPKFKQPLLVKKSEARTGEKRDQENEADVSSTSTESVHVVANGNVLRKSYRDDDSLEESSEADCVRKATWNSALNEYRRASASLSDNLTRKHATKTSSSLQNLVIFRFDGEVNILFTPLFVEALQRYTSSISKQENLLHPALVVDLVHGICTTTADNIYRKRMDETSLEDSLSCKSNEITAFINTSKIHLAFLQVAFPEAESNSDNAFTSEVDKRIPKDPNTSILAGSFEGISTKVLSVQKAGEPLSSSKNTLDENDDMSTQKEKPSEESVTHKTVHRNTSSVMNIKCNEAQIQLHELCNKEDFEKSITTAIADNLSRTKFSLNVDHLHSLTDSQNADDIPPNSLMNLLMLECGLENITVCGGSECGSGSEVLPKMQHKNHPTKAKPKPTVHEKTTIVEEPKFHGFANPFSEESGSVVLNMDSPQEDDHSHTIDLSSLSSSISSLSSSGGGDESDMESEAGEQEELLSSLAEKEAHKAWLLAMHERDSLIDKDVELARRIDVKFHLSSIWFNISSPPSSKTLPSNYHLYNSLVTTIVPLSIAWIPGILELKERLATVCRNRHDRLTSVIACLMSQALPEHGKIPKKHGIHVLVNDIGRYLQEDHSSQLIYTLRKQLMGSRLEKVQSALIQKNRIPDNKKLVKGIFALARQWKCFLAGTEKGEILFYGTNSIKRHVVGRGVLTERDRAILMKEDDHHVQEITRKETTGDTDDVQSQEIEGEPLSFNSDEQQQQHHQDETSKLLGASAIPMEEVHTSQRTPLLEPPEPPANTDSETDESPPTTLRNKHLLVGENKKYGHRKQLSLYSWLSNTPGTSPSTTAKPATDGGGGNSRPTKLTIQSPLVSPIKQKEGLFTEMVSVPTSGKKIQDEKETFKTLLQAIGLKPKVAEEKDTAKTISLTINLKYLRVDLVDGEINNVSKHKKKPKTTKQLFKDDEPIFLAKDFNFRLLFSKSPLNADIFGGDLQALSSSMINRVKFSVGFGNITQKVNLPFVRLVIQVVDMVDVLASLIRSKKQEIEADQVDGPTPVFTNIFGATRIHNNISPSSVKCWKTMYQVLDLYSSLPREPKIKPGFKKAGTGTPGSGRVDSPMRLKEVKIDIEDGPQAFSPPHCVDNQRPLINTYSIVGMVTLPRARLLASIGDLRQEIEIKDVSFVLTKTEEKDFNETDHHSGSISFHIGNVSGVLLDKFKQNDGLVVSLHMSRSHAVYSYQSRANTDKNVALVTVGIIDVEIPQHPVALHTMMTRSSRTISRHITDIQSQRTIIKSMGVSDTSPPTSYSKRLSGVPAEFVKHHFVGSPTGMKIFADSVDGVKPDIIPVKCDVVLKGFCLSASLLPSLRTGYKIGRISATTRTGPCSKFKATMPSHSLMFSSKVQTFESNVPSSATVDLPPVKVSGEFLAAKLTRPRPNHRGQRGHLVVSAEIGAFQHSLTTDLLNHLVFVQKSFMKEVNDVVQRVSGESQPVPLWRTPSSESVDSSKHKEVPFSYSFGLTLKGIQITATTPAATAVRLDTGVISLEVSNAVPSPVEHGKLKRSGSFVKLFGKAQVDINISLGQFIKSRMIDNEVDYVQMAYFKTTIGVRNSFQDVSSTHGTEDKETFLITLTQPKVYAQQMAFDKAVLVYLNYKNAYEHWNQQKMSLHAEVHTATQALLEKLPARTHAAQLSGSLFLQVTVDRLGICVPLLSTNQPTAPGIKQITDEGSVLILSVDEMMLSCCSSSSLVSRGKFNKFCLWFADKFDMEAADWTPDSNSRLMNTCVVSEGTYELCSRTNRYPVVPDMVKTGKWVMSIRWQMCGVEVLFDTNIGKWLSLLGNTLTAFAGETDIANLDSVADMTEKEPVKEPVGSVDEVDHHPSSSRKSRKRNIEREMWEQSRKVNELRRRSDVSRSSLEKETKLLQELEKAVFNEFRKGVHKKIRRHSRSRQTYPYHINAQAATPPQRRAMSERPKSSKTRSRLRKQIAEEDSDYDGELLSKRKPKDRLNTSDIPVFAAPNVSTTLHNNMESTSTLTWSKEDVLDERQDGIPFCSTPDYRQSFLQPAQHKVTFSTSATALNESGSFTPKGSMLMQQNLDFKLDVIVNIDSGKCVLHLPSGSDENIDTRTPSNRMFDPPRSKPFSPNYSAGARRYKTNNQDINSQQDTIILLPGVDVRVNYSSNFECEPGSPSFNGQDGSSVFLVKPPDQVDGQAQSSSSNTKVFKTAGVYISVLFQSLPQEMVLKPSLIDFLEQALEPIIVPNDEETTDGVGSVSDNGSDPEYETGGSIVSSSMSESSTFPVDVVVVFRVKPSDIRLSCQPVSKVECMLRLPALDVVFSSKSSSNRTPVLMTSGEQLRLDEKTTQGFDSGGMSFTICLSSFSFCIFHPYGKEHTVVNRTTSATLDSGEHREDNRPRFRYNPPQPISGKKDSLSLDVEFIKFNLSRRRVCDGYDSATNTSPGSTSSTVVKVSGICDIGSAAFTYDMRRLNEILDFPKAWYKRRLVSRLFLGKEGSYAAKSAKVSSNAPFQTPQVVKTTMEEKRRSSPITPEIQRTPQGRPVLSRSMSEDERHMQYAMPTLLKTPAKQKSTHKKTTSNAGLFSFLPTSPNLFRSMTMTGNRHGLLSPTTPRKMKRRTLSEYESKKQNKTHQEDHSSSDNVDTEVDGPLSQSSSSSTGSKSKWETVIVVAVNLSRLDVNTNMGSVMGQTLWSTSDLRAQAHLTLTSAGRRHLKTKLKVRQAVCESRSGIVGGHGEINELVAKASGTEERGSKPEHSVYIKLNHAESRIDYMGTCILMGNISDLQADLNDQWILQQEESPSTDSLFKIEKESPVQKEPPQCKIYVKADMSWTDFKLMISRSTTPDLIKMMAKIQEFFIQQHRNSLRALSTLRNPTPLNAGTILSNLATPQSSTTPQAKEKDAENDGLKYQHWSKVLNAVYGIKLSMLNDPIPDRGVILGGSLALHGKSVSLACYHGVNFRAQSWVLFNLKQLYSEFVSRVRAEEKSCYVRRVRAVQTLLIKLGHGEDDDNIPGNLSPSMTHCMVVRKVSRGRRNPPSMGSTVQEWLTYVCATGDDDIYPSEEPDKHGDSFNSSNKKQSQGNRARTNSYRYEHDSEPVFGLPKFELELETKHDMPMSYLASTWSRKKHSIGSRALSTRPSPHVVQCSLTSSFEDSLCVTMDVGLLFFLHDVVKSYIKENETSSGSLPRGSPSTARSDTPEKDAEREVAPKVDQQKRIRQFRSEGWKLEPRVRFMSWAGKNIEPVNIDWVLQKLGFTHARLTIPKWAQRGAMDPMDVFISLLIDKMMATMQEDPNN